MQLQTAGRHILRECTSHTDSHKANRRG